MEVTLTGARPAPDHGVSNRTVALRRLARDPGAVAGAVVVLIVAMCAIFAPLIARTDPNLQNLSSTLVPPMWMTGGSGAHPLGTDNLGRDLLARIIWGSRVSAIVGICVVAIGGSIGVTAGLLAGYRRGWVDALIARITDVQLAFPLVLLAVAIVAVVGPGLWTVIAAIGLTSWVQYVRVVRAETLSLRERAPRQFRAAHTGRETQIILDAGAGAGLPARRFAFDDRRPQAFRGAIHGSREPGRPAADDQHVIERLCRNKHAL